MRIARASESDIESLREFLKASESVLMKEKYGWNSAEENWQYWDDDDEDKVLILKIRSNIANEDGIHEDKVDNRILMYEFLKRKYRACDAGWQRVYYAACILLDQVCDPTIDILDYHPSFEINHVAKEQ